MVAIILIFLNIQIQAQEVDQYWLELKAKDKYERTQIVEMGLPILELHQDSVVVLGNIEDESHFAEKGLLLNTYPVSFRLSHRDFPNSDKDYHSFIEMEELLDSLSQDYPEAVRVSSLGNSHEGRKIYLVHLSADHSQKKPGIVFMGGHHAREHLSMETPIRLMKHFAEEFAAGVPRVVNALENYDIYFIPMVNPDGKQHDIKDGNYKFWRKNRKDNGDGSFGVDLNRNYGYAWGTGGSSSQTSSDVYMGKKPFSEPETQAIKKFHEDNPNISISVSFHTFSQLILYPWGHTDDRIISEEDYQVHKIMAETMAQWNGYEPMQSADLYIASGDTTDWSYGELGMISFTFELDPKSFFGGGFYPGDEIIEETFSKNLEPAFYLIERADDPYRVLRE